MVCLENVMKGKERFHLVYLGGSITEGAGAQSPGTAYRSVVTQGLRKRFPKVRITDSNAGIGGTGSDLGMFRLEKDVLAEEPDLVFIEFAVNDAKADRPEIFMESIVRRLKKRQPDVLIVFVYTTCEDMNRNDYDQGKTPGVILAHETVAKHYAIPSVQAGYRLYRKIREEKCGSRAYLPDGVHPNDQGHKIYGEEILKVLETAEFDIEEREILYSDIYEMPQMYETAKMKVAGWNTSYADMCRRLPGYLYSNTPGTALSIYFQGRIIGFFWTVEKDSGDIYYTIDGGKKQRCSAWDHFANQFPRAHYCILARDLKEGSHVLKIWIAEEKNEQSEGFYIRIGAVLADGEITVQE